MPYRTISFKSHLPVTAEEALAWHSREGAFERLSPPWSEVTVIDATGTNAPGDRKQVRIKLGLLNTNWTIVHEALDSGVGFADRQIEGPFEEWFHEHRFADDPDGGCWLEDRIRYRLPYRAVGDTLLRGRIESELTRVFTYRHQVTHHDLAAHARFAGRQPLRIAITGATGLVGSRLVPFLRAGGHTVHRIVRTATGRPDEITWSPGEGRIDADALEGFDAVIHMAGESIAGGRWNKRRMERIRSSRIKGTTLLATTLAELDRPPASLISTSAVGYYGIRGDERLSETSSNGDGFLADVCWEWESSADPALHAGIRVVHPRFGVIVAGDGGMIGQLTLPFRLGLGGRIGNGKQYLSWIHIDDLLGVLLESVMNDGLNGPVNAVAPGIVTNAEFTKAMGSVLKRPTIVPVPVPAARVAFGEMADELLMASQRAEPAVLTEAGFSFSYPTIDRALEHELAPKAGRDLAISTNSDA